MSRWMMLTAAMLALAGSEAHAQTQTSTCGWQYEQWVCRTVPSRQPYNLYSGGNAAFEGAGDGGEAVNAFMDRAARVREQAQAERAARAETEARQRATLQAQQQAAADQSLAEERRRVEAIEIVQSYISAHRCDDAVRVATQYFGQKGAQDAEELCPSVH